MGRLCIVTDRVYCRACKKYSNRYHVAFGGDILGSTELACGVCKSTEDVEQTYTCAACGKVMRGKDALYNEDEEMYYCSSCRKPCSICGQAHVEELMSEDESGNLWCIDCELGERNKF